MAGLANCILKLDRASAHIIELETSINNFADSFDRNAISVNQDKEALENYARFEGVDLPQEWGAIVGDALFNMRSALDHLAWDLVLAHGANCVPHRSKREVIRFRRTSGRWHVVRNDSIRRRRSTVRQKQR